MRIIFYNYFVPYRNLLKKNNIERFNTFKEFHNNWIRDEECIIILPVQVFDLVGLDIRFILRNYGRDDSKRFLFIGDRKQIEFALSQNDKFLQNIIDEVHLPILSNTLEVTILEKIKLLEKKGKKV